MLRSFHLKRNSFGGFIYIYIYLGGNKGGKESFCWLVATPSILKSHDWFVFFFFVFLFFVFRSAATCESMMSFLCKYSIAQHMKMTLLYLGRSSSSSAYTKKNNTNITRCVVFFFRRLTRQVHIMAREDEGKL